MGYAVDASALYAYMEEKNAPHHIAAICKRIEKALSQLDNPRSMGGEYRNSWYYVSGKYQIKAAIDDVRKIIYLIKYIKLP